MNCHDIAMRLHDYVEATLPAVEMEEIRHHLAACPQCHAEYGRLIEILDRVTRLSKEIQPAHDLWSGIADRLESPAAKPRGLADAAPHGTHKVLKLSAGRDGEKFSRMTKGLGRGFVFRWAIAAGIVLVAAGGWYLRYASRPAWEVARLDGAPKIDSKLVGEIGELGVGQYLETDDSSRAMINVGQIGQVEIEPNSRIKLVKARLNEHRLALEHGTMHAMIWAPPRLFFVDTPSAVAVDLGCAYTLTVDEDGIGRLHVTSGWVAFERDGRESIVPAGAACETRPQTGPGTPVFEDASPTLRQAVSQLDFGHGDTSALATVVSEARKKDSLTLWHLLSRVDRPQREQILARLADLCPPPRRVTPEGVLELDQRMLDRWRDALEDSWL